MVVKTIREFERFPDLSLFKTKYRAKDEYVVKHNGQVRFYDLATNIISRNVPFTKPYSSDWETNKYKDKLTLHPIINDKEKEEVEFNIIKKLKYIGVLTLPRVDTSDNNLQISDWYDRMVSGTAIRYTVPSTDSVRIDYPDDYDEVFMDMEYPEDDEGDDDEVVF